jgi:aspartate/methionine/tyrosine aminotransferase
MMELASRARRMESGEAVSTRPEIVPEVLVEAVAAALAAGETHYTPRPGLVELRRSLASWIRSRGGPSYSPEASVVVTAGEQEALFVSLLALACAPGEALVQAAEPLRHRALFQLMGLEPSIQVSERTQLLYREQGFAAPVDMRWPDLLNVGAKGELGPVHPDRTLLIGGLDELPGMASFRVGFVAGPENVLKRVQTWKQAFSICTAGPSQRAALAALPAMEAL